MQGGSGLSMRLIVCAITVRLPLYAFSEEKRAYDRAARCWQLSISGNQESAFNQEG
jgi:hypothetical protein